MGAQLHGDLASEASDVLLRKGDGNGHAQGVSVDDHDFIILVVEVSRSFHVNARSQLALSEVNVRDFWN